MLLLSVLIVFLFAAKLLDPVLEVQDSWKRLQGLPTQPTSRVADIVAWFLPSSENSAPHWCFVLVGPLELICQLANVSTVYIYIYIYGYLFS